jgi:hypothetical protein
MGEELVCELEALRARGNMMLTHGAMRMEAHVAHP